jgi:hypothetical protein
LVPRAAVAVDACDVMQWMKYQTQVNKNTIAAMSMSNTAEIAVLLH